jgi:hypothetical protein
VRLRAVLAFIGVSFSFLVRGNELAAARPRTRQFSSGFGQVWRYPAAGRHERRGEAQAR